MNYVVFLDAGAGELEKILSGTKSMLLKEIDPACVGGQEVSPGDDLYFLRDKGDCDLRVKATVTHVLSFTDQLDEGLSHILKEMQTRLQLTEEQFNHWSVKQQVLCIEFSSARKIEVIHVASDGLVNQSVSEANWVAFEELSQRESNIQP